MWLHTNQFTRKFQWYVLIQDVERTIVAPRSAAKSPYHGNFASLATGDVQQLKP